MVVVHDPCGQILLLQRADIEDFWQSVTGSLRWQETPQQAAVREVAEETKIRAGQGLLDWHRSVTFDILDRFKARYAPHREQNLEHMFSLEIDSGQPITLNPKEHVCYIWLDYPEALARVWSWSNRAAIRLVAQKYWPVADLVD